VGVGGGGGGGVGGGVGVGGDGVENGTLGLRGPTRMTNWLTYRKQKYQLNEY